MTAQHHLIVPDDPDLPMEITHPADCPQHGQLGSARSSFDGSYLCPFEEAQWRTGLEVFFGRDGEQVPLFTRPAVVVGAGRYPISCDDTGLRLASTREAVS